MMLYENNIIPYKEIVAFSGKVDHAFDVKIGLSRYQAWLYESKINLLLEAGQKQTKVGTFLSGSAFALLQILILLSAPRMSFLGGNYHDYDEKALRSLTFHKDEFGTICLIIPGKSSQETIGDRPRFW